MTTTLVLTMVIPLQFAVLVGVGISVILFVIRQSNRLTTKQLELGDGGRIREVDPPQDVPPRQVLVLQPYGSVFFATAPVLEEQLPSVTPESVHSVVILRLRGAEEFGATLLDVLVRYTRALHAVGSKLVLVTDNPRIERQLRVTGSIDVLGEDNLYLGTEWIHETVRHAHRDALDWVAASSSS